MAISLTNIINKVDRQKVIPYDWQKMEIKVKVKVKVKGFYLAINKFDNLGIDIPQK